MGLVQLFDSQGNALKDAGGNFLYVDVPAPDPQRVVKVPKENRVARVPRSEG